MGCNQSKATYAADGSQEQRPKTEPRGIISNRRLKEEAGEIFRVLNPIVALQSLVVRPDKSSEPDERKRGRHQAHHLRNIFAVPLEDNEMSSYKTPYYEKAETEREFLIKAVRTNIFFESLTNQELNPFIDAFEKTAVNKDEVVIQQGTVGDYFYVIFEGSVFFEVDGKVVGTPATKGASFGELALLYSCPRAATVTAVEATTLFRVDQRTFRYILQSQTENGVQAKFDLLAKVPFLSDLSTDNIKKLANAMTPINFTSGQVMVEEGNEVEYFALVETGKLAFAQPVPKHSHRHLLANVTNGDHGSEERGMVELGPGDYYGEYVMIPGNKRVANVTARSSGRIFTIKPDTFTQILGTLDSAVIRSLDRKLLVSGNVCLLVCVHGCLSVVTLAVVRCSTLCALVSFYRAAMHCMLLHSHDLTLLYTF
jgi:cAMP-dependent protein kinase regulator